jgi:hypothetical protein
VSQDVQDLLDGLIRELCPDWSCVLPSPLENSQERYGFLIAAKRMQVARVLQRQPERAAPLAGQVLAAIVADEDPSSNRQLVEPLVAAIGRRAVLAGLLSYVQSGSPAQQAGATRGWYWAQPFVVYATGADLDAGQPTVASQVEAQEVADLRRAFRIACLTAFLTTTEVEVRATLAMWFTLAPEDYPAEMAAQLDQARRIAVRNRQRYQRLLANTTEPELSRLGQRPSRMVVPEW